MKLLLVCTNGGHFATMQSLKNFWCVHEREWVTHRSADTLAIEAKEKVHFVHRQDSRDLPNLLRNVLPAYRILRSVKPDLIVSTGASVAVPFFYFGKLLGIRTLFIESISRVERPSLSGRLVYPFADEFYVQWEECARRYPKAQYRGMVL